MSPPLGPQGLDETIETLKKKEVEYIEAGESLLKQEKIELEQQIEQDVDDDLEREAREAQGFEDEDGYYDEDEGLMDDGKEAAASKAPLRGGARGRASKPGDRDWKGNNDRKRKALKGEFEASDDDDEEEKEESPIDPYSKPSRGGGKQVNQGKNAGRGRGGKNKMEFNDEDFPSFG